MIPARPPRPRGALPSPTHAVAGAAPFRMLAAAPAQCLRLPRSLSWWGNQADRVCVTTDEAFARACDGVMIAEKVALDWAAAHDVLHGAVIIDVLRRFASGDGFRQDGNVYCCGAPRAIDFSHAPTLQAAVAEGPVKLGVAADQLDAVVGDVSGWVATGLVRDARLDHCVGVCGSGPLGWLASQLALATGRAVTLPRGVSDSAPAYAVFTWRTVGLIDHPSLLNVTGEAWARSPTTRTIGSNPPSRVSVFTAGLDVPLTPPPPSRLRVRLSRTVPVHGDFVVRDVPAELAAGDYWITPAG